MFKRLMMTLVLAVSATACVDTDATPDTTPTDRVVEVQVPMSQSRVEDGQVFSLTPSSECSNTFCAGKPIQTVCYCTLGSGLHKASTCGKRCIEGPPGGDLPD